SAQNSALRCGSRSTTRTFSRFASAMTDRLSAIVVLPTPPFCWMKLQMRKIAPPATRWSVILHLEQRRSNARASQAGEKTGERTRPGVRWEMEDLGVVKVCPKTEFASASRGTACSHRSPASGQIDDVPALAGAEPLPGPIGCRDLVAVFGFRRFERV